MALIDDVREYVNRSHAYAWFKAGSSVPDEPALISALLTKDMYRGLRRALGNYLKPSVDISVRGIFTHQTPKVQMHGRRSVEIADLMLIHQHFNKPGHQRPYGNALLFQAKKTNRPATGSLNSKTQKVQFELYQQWRPFEGKSRLPQAPPGAQDWNFQSANVNAVEGAQYLTVFDQQAYSLIPASPVWNSQVSNGKAHSALTSTYPNGCTWSAGGSPAPNATASNGVNCPEDFGVVFARFLQGTHGRNFQPGVFVGPDHWSIFVNTMLQISAASNNNYVYNSANQGVLSGMRGRDLLYLGEEIALQHAYEEEIDVLMAGYPELLRGEAADYIPVSQRLFNGIVNAGGQLVISSGLPPFRRAGRSESKRYPGHIPVLIVTTVGEEQPFDPDAFTSAADQMPNRR